MKRVFPQFVLIGIVFLAASAVAAGDLYGGCRLEGSWMGFSPDGSRWLATYHGESGNGGTLDAEFFFDPTLGGFFPDAVRMSSGRGVWVRTGGNTFAFTEIVYGLDTSGNVNWIIKNSGKQTITEGCSLMNIDSTIEVFLPEVDPFDGDALLCLPDEGVWAVPMRVDPPCSVE